MTEWPAPWTEIYNTYEELKPQHSHQGVALIVSIYNTYEELKHGLAYRFTLTKGDL